MATNIKLKKSSVPGRVPLSGDLDYGEIAINYADGKIYYKNSSNQIKAFIDSATIQSLVGSGGGAAGVDSAAIISLIDSAYVSSRLVFDNAANVELAKQYATADSGQTLFSGLTYQSKNLLVFLNGIVLDPRIDYTANDGATLTLTSPADSGDQLFLIDHTSLFNLENAIVDSQDVTNIINTAYVQARQDYSYSSLTGVPSAFIPDGVDSGATTSLINTAYIQARQDFGYSSLTGIPNVLDSADITDIVDTTYIQGIVNTAYVQARQDFAYASLTGAPNILDSAAVATIAGGTGGVDSAAIFNLIDSAYVESRVPLSLGGGSVDNYIFTADSGDITFTGIDDNGRTLAVNNQFVQIHLNGLLLIGSEDYTTNGNTVTLTQAADSGDQLVISNFKSFFNASSNIDSATILSLSLDAAEVISLVDSAYVQTRQTPQDFAYSSLTGTPNILDSADVLALAPAQDFAYSSLTGAPNVLDSADVSTLITTAVDALVDGAPGALDTLNELAIALNDDSNAIATINNTLALKLNIADVTPQDFAYSSLTGTPNILDSADVLALAPAQDFAYSSLTGAPNVLDSADVLAIATATGGIDSAAIEAMIDSNYVASRVSLAYAGNASVQNYKFIADSGQTAFTGLSYSDQFVQVYLNGVLLLDTDDYTKSGNNTITLTTGADSGDQLIVSDFTSFFTNQTVDSAQINSLIDSALGNVGRATVTNYKFVADSAQTIFTGADENAVTLGFANQLVQVYLNGVLLLDSDDYAKSNNDTITLVTPATLGDQLIISDYKSFFTSSGFDSAGILSFIDQDYIRNNQTTYASLSEFNNDTKFLDSNTVTDVIDAAYIQANQTAQDFAYSSLTGTPNILDSADVLSLSLDASEVTSLVDSAYVQARQTPQDFAFSSLTGTPTTIAGYGITDAFDGAYSSLTGTPNVLDSADITNVIDATYIQANQTAQDFAYSSLTGTPNVLDSADVLALAPAQDFAYASLTGVPNILDSADVLALAPAQDFAYSSLTGAPNVLDSADVLAIANAAGGVDSAAIEAMIDSNYVASRVSLAYAGNAQVQNTKFIADSAQTVFTGLSYADQFVQVYLNGVLLLDSDDYVKSGNDTITLTTGAASGDQLIVSDFKAFFTNQTVDSAQINSLIDSALGSVGRATVTNYKFVADSGDTIFTGTDANGLSLSYNNQLVQVYLNGLLLTESTDYTKTGNDTITLVGGADSGDELSIVDFNSFFTYNGFDSAGITSIINASYIQANQTAQDFAYSSLTGAPNVLDSADVLALAPAQDFAYSSLTGTPSIPSTLTDLNITDGNANSILTTDGAGNFSFKDSATLSTLVVNNLTVTGTQTTVDATTLTVEDPIIHLATANENTDAIDIGFVGHYSDDGGSTKNHTGLIRDASDQEYYLFESLVQASLDSADPSLTVNVGGTNWSLATFNTGSIKANSISINGEAIDSAYVQARQTAQDFAYSSLTGTPNILDSADVLAIAPAQDFAYASLTGTPNILDSADVLAIAPAQDFAYSSLTGTPTTIAGYGITDAFDGAYTSLTGTPNVLDSADVTAIAAAAGGVDSAAIEAMIDSNYVASRVTLAYAGNAEVKNYKFIADSNQTIFTGADENAVTLGFTNQLVQVYLNGVLLLDSDDYTKSNNNTITLTQGASVGDQVIVSDFKSFFTNQTVDSAQINSLIDSALGTVGRATVTNYKFVADSAQTTFTGTDANGLSLSYSNQLVQVYLNGVLLLDSDDYTKSGNNTITLTDTAYSGDQLIIADYKSFFTSSGFDSAGITNVIDATYIQANQTAQDFAYSSLTGAPNVLDSAEVISLIDSAYVSARAPEGYTNTDVISLVDSAYVQARQISGGNVSQFTNDAGYTDFDSNNLAGALKTFSANRIQLSANNSYFGIGTSTGSAGMAIKNNSGQPFHYGQKYLPANNGQTDLELEANTGGKINVNGFRIYNVGTPTDNTDAATKLYVDNNTFSGNYNDLTNQPTIFSGSYTDLTNKPTLFDGAYSSLTGAPNVLDSADVLAIAGGSGSGGGLDSAAAINIIDSKILQLDIGDIVGTDGNPGEVLQSNGNGNSSWTDIKLIAKQKAFAMSLIFG